MQRVKSFNSSLHNVSKKRLAQMQDGTFKTPARAQIAKTSAKSATEWRKARQECIRIWGNKCALCGRSDLPIHVHHIILRTLEPKLKYEQDNLCCLCSKCHKHSGYDEDYIILTQKLIALGLGTKYNLLVSNKRIVYEMEKI